MVFIHNKNYATLDYSNAYGGQYFSIDTGLRPNDSKHFASAAIALKLDIVDLLDVEENYCPPPPDTHRDFNLEECLTKFYANKIGCSSPWEGSSFVSDFPPCHTASQYKGDSKSHYDTSCMQLYNHFHQDYFEIKNIVMNSGPGKIYNITGCTGSCRLPRYQASILERVNYYDIHDDQADTVSRKNNPELEERHNGKLLFRCTYLFCTQVAITQL